MIIHNPILTGSFTVNGTDVASITSSAASITALNSYTASQNILNGTYATTGSNTFKNPQTINSNLIVTGSITAATLVVQTITSSVIYSSGSNVFGNSQANTQVFTGSVNITGSTNLIGSLSGTSATFSLGVTIANNNWLNFTDTSAVSRNILLLASDNNLYLQYKSGSNLLIRDTNGTERMRITSGGNVGIGTSSPSAILDVRGASIYMNMSDTSDSRYINFGNWVAGRSQIEVGGGDFFIKTQSSNYLAFGTNASERMRITSAGQVYVANTSGLNGMLNSTTTDGNFALTLFDAFGNNALAGFRNSSAAQIGSITIVSGGSTTSYNTTSDYRLKEDLKDFNGLEKVSAIKVYNFKWKLGDYRMDGVIAHELAEVIPYAVVGEKDAEEMQSVDYSKLTPVLVKAIQEQQAQIQELQAQITELKNK